MVQVRKLEFFESADGHIRRDWMWMDRFYREQIEDGTVPSLRIPYQPSRWDQDGTKELFDGWREENGYCPKCFMLRSNNGACDCG